MQLHIFITTYSNLNRITILVGVVPVNLTQLLPEMGYILVMQLSVL